MPADVHPVIESQDADLDPKIRTTLEDVKETFRVPVLDPLFRTLASRPAYLELAWRQLKPNVQTLYFERQSDEIRAHAVRGTARLGGAPAPPQAAGDVLKVFHYVDAKILLAVSALRAATNGQVPALLTLPMEERRQIEVGIPQGTPEVALVDPQAAPDAVRSVFTDIAAVTGQDQPNGEYRALASWPEYFGWAWQAVKAGIRREAFDALVRELLRMTDNATLSLPYRMELGPHTLRLCGLEEGDIDWVRETIDRYRPEAAYRVATTAFLSVGAEGDYGAASSPFPVNPR